ncbi:MAG: hypothetical protein ACREDM_13330 [Methylocella sp.]
MSSVVIFRARQVMIAMCLMAAFSGNASASPKTITVQGQTGRPVAEAVLELERRYGWQITYEDPPYVHFGDIVDVTDAGPEVPVQSQSQLESLRGAHRTLGPKTVSLTFTLPSADPDEMAAVEALLKSYNEGHRGFEFAVVQGAGMLHIVPRQARGLSGNLEPVKPVLDTVITIEPKERAFGALLKEVFKKVSVATNTHIMFGTVSGNMINSKTSIGGSGKTARSILEQWFLGGGGLSWELMNAPAHNVYVFSIIQPIPNKDLTWLPRQSPAGKP